MDLLLVVLLVLWMAGSFGSHRRARWVAVEAPADGPYTGGGSLVHLLLVLVAIIIALRLFGSPYYHGFWF